MKRLIFDDYLEELTKYKKIHGHQTILLMQVGGFFEIYAFEDESIVETLHDVAAICNFQISKKDKKKALSRSNPYMAGFPLAAIDKYISILINNNYTTVLIEQVTPAPDPERKVTNIYSPGTLINNINSSDTNYLMSIYIEHWGQINNATKSNTYVGISVIDLSTGKNIIYETYSKIDDVTIAFDEIYRSIQIHNPAEIVFTYDYLPNSLSTTEFKQLLEICSKKCHFIDKLNKNYKIKSYQTQLLKQIFPKTGLLSVIEYLDLEHMGVGLISYIILLNFAHSHNENIINKINKPEIWDSEKYLVLTNNSIHQLDLVSPKDNINKTNSLFGIINNTSTAIGKRLLKNYLLNPIKDITQLNKRYDYIEDFLRENNEGYIYRQIEEYLSNIRDLERLHRKLSLTMLEPYQFVSLDIAYSLVIKIIDYVRGECPIVSQLLPSQNCMNQFKNFLNEYRSDFDMDEINKYNLNNITKSFFKTGREPAIDKIQDELDECFNFMNALKKRLSDLLEKDSNFVKLNRTEKDGYYFSTTYKRSNTLKKKLKNMCNKSLKIKVGNKNIKIKPNDINFSKRKKSECVIEANIIEKYTNKVYKLTENIKYIVREAFLNKLKLYDNKYIFSLKEIVRFISEIDVIKSNAKTSIKYNYTKPIIDKDTQYSYMDIKHIRHPIIERIQTNIEYVPNDVKIGIDNTTGILLYGTNASGKSSLMKSLGLNIIMAQAGMYVSASEFKYVPYDYLFTRIRNNDNLFRGQSSFAVEMSELRSILKRSNSRSLVLGDELCSGTETYSALSIFATSVHRLSKSDTSFIFATHLHELCKLDIIKNIDNIKIKHLKVIYNEENDKLIYDRKLEDGSGPATYGLEVCKAMDMDDNFLKMANEIRRNLMNIDEDIIPHNTSKYNSNLYIKNCMICDSNEDMEVHHINFQCKADKNKYIDHIHKDELLNLVPLCKECHNTVHNKKLEIYGYKQTTDGVELDYKIISDDEFKNKKKNRKKFTDAQINIIRNFEDIPNLTQKVACYKLEKEHNIKISTSTLSKIWKNTY